MGWLYGMRIISQKAVPQKGGEGLRASVWTTCSCNTRMPCSHHSCVFIINNALMPVTSSESVLKLKEIKIICLIMWTVGDSASPVTAARCPSSLIHISNCCCCSGTKSCPTVCNPMNCSTPDFSFTPRVCSNSCPLSQWYHPIISSSVIPFSSHLQSFQHQGLFQWVSSSHQVAKVLELQLEHQSFHWIFRVDLLESYTKALITKCKDALYINMTAEYMYNKVVFLKYASVLTHLGNLLKLCNHSFIQIP